MFHLGVAFLPRLLPIAELASATHATAIVIDTLRFTTTACVALEAGATAMEVLSDIEAARQLASTRQPTPLLCGERLCQKIPGFNLGNSPLEYSPATVRHQTLLFSTTNGTLAVESAQFAQSIALGCLLNRAAVARWANRRVADLSAANIPSPDRPLWIICAGTDGQIATEDVLTAGAIADHLSRQPGWELLNDSAYIALDAWRQVARQQSLLTSLQSARGGRNLIEAGFAADVEFASRLDQVDCVPIITQKPFPQGQFPQGQFPQGPFPQGQFRRAD